MIKTLFPLLLVLVTSLYAGESGNRTTVRTLWEDTEPPVFGVHGYNQRPWTIDEWSNINDFLPMITDPHEDPAALFKGLDAVRQLYENEQKMLSMKRLDFIKEIINPLCHMLTRIADDCNLVAYRLTHYPRQQMTPFSTDPDFYAQMASLTLFPTNKLFDILYLRGDILKEENDNYLSCGYKAPIYFFEDEEGFRLFPSLEDKLSLTRIASSYLDKKYRDMNAYWTKAILTRDGHVIPHAGILYIFDPKKKTVRHASGDHKDSLYHYLYSGKRGIPEEGIPPFYIQPFDRGRLNNTPDKTEVGCDEIEHMIQNDQSVACGNGDSLIFEVTQPYVHSERLCADLLMLEGLQENAQAGHNKDLADWFEETSGQPLSQTIHDLEQEMRAQITKELLEAQAAAPDKAAAQKPQDKGKKKYKGPGAKKKNKAQAKKEKQKAKRQVKEAKSAANSHPVADAMEVVAEKDEREPVHIIQVTFSEKSANETSKEKHAPLGQKKNKVKERQAQREVRYQTQGKAAHAESAVPLSLDEQVEQTFQAQKAKGREKFRKLKQQLNKLTGALTAGKWHQKTRGSHTVLHTADGRPITVVRPHGKKDTSVPKARMSQLLGHLRNRLFAQTRRETQLADSASNEDALS